MRFVPTRFLGRRSNKSKTSLISQASSALARASSMSFKARGSSSKQKANSSEDFYPVFKITVLLPSSVCNASLSTTTVTDSAHLHTALYVQTDPLDNTGYIHHVVGSILLPAGLGYAWQPFTLPQQPQGQEASSASPNSPVRTNDGLGDVTLVTNELVGFTAKDSYPEHWETILRREVPVPGWQVSLNPGTGRYQMIRSLNDESERETRVVEWWEDGEGPEIVGCQEWLEVGAVPILESRGLIARSVE